MPPPDGVQPEDLAACRALLDKGSKSFSLAARILPRVARDRATVLYAFCRVADDAVDADPNASEATVVALRARLARAYAGNPDDSAVDRALACVVAGAKIPIAIPEALLEGMLWDATGRTYRTLDEVYAYCARVAGTVGVMMTLAMGVRDPTTLARAADLGVAMQLTNIARDIGEDARNKRLYLPRDWFVRARLDPDAFLVQPTASREVRAMVAELLDLADVLYDRADFGIPRLPRACRIAIRAARLIYADIGRVVTKAGYDSVSRRAVTSKARKIWLLLRAIAAVFWGSHDASRDPVPALPSNQPLLDACREGS